jgi:hypothetical protein
LFVIGKGKRGEKEEGIRNSGLPRLVTMKYRHTINLSEGNNLQGIIGTFMGRDGLSLAVEYLGLGAGDKVLLPAYLCRVVLTPFLGKAEIEFYDLESDLTINPKEIAVKLKQDGIKAILIINYFGFLQPYRKEIKEICEDRGVVVIEDCAHSLLTEGSGETGDLSIYSFAKILPVPDGGGLKLRLGGYTIDPQFYPRSWSNMLSILITLKSILRLRADMLSRAWVSSRNVKARSGARSKKKSTYILPLSSFAYKGIVKRSPFHKIIEKRRVDYKWWHSLANGTSLFEGVFNELPSGVCPLGYPIKIENRDFIKSVLERKGVFLKTHWHLPNAVGAEYSNSQHLSRRMITLPVYPELNEKDRDIITRFLGL